MRNSKIIWILAAAVLAGCSSEDSLPVAPAESNVPLKFSTNIMKEQNGTRATGVIEEPADMAENGFGVFCLYTKDKTYEELFRNGTSNPVASADTATIMNNLRISSPDGGASWTYDHTRYWPVDQSLSFFTYAPYITNSTATDVTEDSPMRVIYNSNKAFSGKIQFYESNDPAKQHDLIYGTTSDGNALTDWQYSKDEGTAEVTTGSGTKITKTGGITSYFRHSTAKLKMFIKNSFDKVENGNQRIYISRVELKNVPQKGELDITKSNITTTSTAEGTTTTSITPAWSNISGNQDIVLTSDNLNSNIAYTGTFDNAPGVITNNNSVMATSSDYLLLMPKDNSQALTDGKLPDGTEPMEIAITYIPISRNQNGQTIEGPAVTVNKTLTNNFEGNKSYTLNIDLGANTTITLNTQPWEENDLTQDANTAMMFNIPYDGYITWTYTALPEDTQEGTASATGYSYSSISTDGIVITEPYYGNRTECSFQINPISGKDITCKAELLECSSDGQTLTGSQSTAFVFEDNNSSTIDITPGSKSTLKINYTGAKNADAYARLRITVTYDGKEYIVYSLTGENTYTEYTLYHMIEND